MLGREGVWTTGDCMEVHGKGVRVGRGGGRYRACWGGRVWGEGGMGSAGEGGYGEC